MISLSWSEKGKFYYQKGKPNGHLSCAWYCAPWCMHLLWKQSPRMGLWCLHFMDEKPEPHRREVFAFNPGPELKRRVRSLYAQRTLFHSHLASSTIHRWVELCLSVDHLFPEQKTHGVTTCEALCLTGSLFWGPRFESSSRQTSTGLGQTLAFPTPRLALCSGISFCCTWRNSLLCLRTATSPLRPHLCLGHLSVHGASLPSLLLDLVTGHSQARRKWAEVMMCYFAEWGILHFW